MTNEKFNELLYKVDIEKRATLKRLMWAAFAAPAIASFPLDGLKIDTALAGATNSTNNQGHHEKPHEKPHENYENPHDKLRRPR